MDHLVQKTHKMDNKIPFVSNVAHSCSSNRIAHTENRQKNNNHTIRQNSVR